MPLELIDLTTAPGVLLQRCAACGLAHTIRLNRGAASTAAGPFDMQEGDTLLVRVDGGEVQTASFARTILAGDQMRDHLQNALSGVTVALNTGAILIESESTGASSHVEIVGGTARKKMTGIDDEWQDAATGRPVLGAAAGDFVNEDAIVLRRCSCGAQETLLRTWDAAPAEVHDTRFDRHRRAVNGLAQQFIAAGWIHPDVEARVRRSSPPDITPISAGARMDLG